MTKVFAHQQGKEKFVGWHAEVSALIKPKIHNEKTINGVRYYFGNGKRYVADLFDKVFKPNKII